MKTTSLELSRRLAPNVKIETEYIWECRFGKWSIVSRIQPQGTFDTADFRPTLPAYTTDELMEWLPDELFEHFNLSVTKVTGKNFTAYSAKYSDGTLVECMQGSTESLPEALGLLAEYLVDNGIYKGKE